MRYYILGIGGIGASYVARYLQHKGHHVEGSDAVDSDLIQELSQEGITVHIGHDPQYITKDIDQVLMSPAVAIAKPADYLRAVELDLPMMTWQEALTGITKEHVTIAVCGTHGKSTTTAMLGVAMEALGMDPTVFVGTKVPQFGNRNLRLGTSPYLVIEADEFHANFLSYIPTWVLCTSLEADHLDFYGTTEKYLEGYEQFFHQILPHGGLVTHASCLHQFRCYDKKLPNVRTLVTDALPDLHWSVLGEHNLENAALVMELLQILTNARDEDLATAISAFTGTWRRQELLGTYRDAQVYDDYAHHPTEVRATLRALKDAYPKQPIYCLFQAHQYSRTLSFLHEFATSFDLAQEVWIMDIYASRDTDADKAKINGQILADEIAKHHGQVRYVGDLKQAEEYAREHVQQGIFVTCGAGDVTQVSRSLVQP